MKKVERKRRRGDGRRAWKSKGSKEGEAMRRRMRKDD
jgi:hypothetical protein